MRVQSAVGVAGTGRRADHYPDPLEGISRISASGLGSSQAETPLEMVVSNERSVRFLSKEVNEVLRSCLILACLCAVSIALSVGPVVGQGTPTIQAPAEAQIEEIELAPGVWVPVDMWEDDYVPTVQDLVALGMSEEDAEATTERKCTWGQIKLCFAGYYNDCCPKKADEG
jgi:hypothetical protein